MSVQTLTVRTTAGPVGLREKRKGLTKIQVRDKGELTIQKQWLSSVAKDEQLYHMCIKQSMLIAARYMDLNDLQDPDNKRTDSPEQVKARLEELRTGREGITTSGHKKVEMKKILKKDEKERHRLVKYSKRCCCDRRERSFIIENGELVIYKSASKNAKISYPTFKMKDALITFETRMPGTYPKPRFDDGYTARVKCVFPDRQAQNKSPFYLYPNDNAQLQSWKRAFQLARVLVSDNDRRALKVSIGRAASASLIKGWDALIIYHKEIAETRRLVKQMALRLMKIEYSRGWSKMKLVNKKIVDDRAKRQEQQLWAARFMSEKLARLGTANAKKASDVRETVITRIQQRFRHYRDEKIFDRQYPIGSKLVSRMRQARQGCQMDVALDVLTCEESLKMTLTDKRSIEKVEKTPEVLTTKKSTYSEVNIPAAEMLLSVSDNLQSIAFTAPQHTTDAWSHLTKSDWSNFVNLDRISQVVLHTAPHLAIKRKEIQPKGVWCTIFGPKIAWGKRIDVIETKDGKQISCNVVGAPDGFVVPKALSSKFAGNTGVKWVHISAQVGAAEWTLEEPKPSNIQQLGGQQPPSKEPPKATYICLHVLGYRFTSKLSSPDAKNFGFEPQPTASVPIASDDAAIVALDNSVLGVEVFEVYEVPPKPGVPRKPDETRQILTGAETLWNIVKPKEGTRMQNYTGRKDHELLLAPPEVQEGAKAMGKISVVLNVAIIDDNQKRDTQPVSPELVGAGILTSLYTSHRGAWHDNELGPGQFRLDHVANFVELSLSGFRFPSTDAPTPESKSATYRIRATLCGISTASPVMHRSQSNWSAVLGPQFADPYVIKFNGSRLCLPLPPGCWGSPQEGKRPHLQLEMIKGEHEIIAPMSYDELEKSENKARYNPAPETVIFRTALTFDGVVVDQVKQVSAFFAKGTKGPDDVVCDVWSNQVKKGKATEAVLNLDFALRDRDYVKSSIGQPPSEQRTICVGDKALMVTEEPLMYPQSKQEFRNRFVQGTFRPGDKWPQDKGRDRGAALREPCLSSEYAASGLAEMVPKVPFKQSIIPNYCTDIIPHKFLLPLSEQQFRQERRPGVWPFILDDLAAAKAASGQAIRGSTVPKTAVTHLTHITRKIPVLLLATYPDGTCDVEIATEFMEQWKKEPTRRYSLPGILQKAGATPAGQPKPPPGKEKDLPSVPIRAIMRRVSIQSLFAVHGSGFHVYDAEYKNIEDLKKAPLPIRGFNPRDANSAQTHEEKLEEFSVSAGPLPGDSSPAACQYEWSLHVRARSENEMNKFVAMLRQCVRVDHHQQSMKMQAYQNKGGEAPVMPMQLQRTSAGGQLEVVLVEARRLGARGIDKHIADIKHSIPFVRVSPISESRLKDLAGTTSGENSKSTPSGADVTTFVNFRMKHNDETIAYKSQKCQNSPTVSGTDSPCWASLPELVNSGGWTFKTGLIGVEKLDDLVIEFEVMQFSFGRATPVGAIQLGVSHRPNLINPKDPFRNLWLPLLSEKEKEPGSNMPPIVTPNKTGEIHVMTRWLPTDKLYLPPGQQQVSVRSHFLKELWPKVCAQRLKEPIYQLEAFYMNYNPNLVRNRWPESPSDHVRRNTEDLYNTVPYLECLERRQGKAWETWDDKMHNVNLDKYRLGELRLRWLEEGDHNGFAPELQTLIEGGIPSARRERLWLDLTMASRVLEREGLGQPRDQSMDPEAARKAALDDYQHMLDLGLPQRSDANTQLQDDSFHLAAWESSTPPVPEFLDFHLKRLKSAQNVCTALIACEKSGVAYCESLLIIAFYLLLPQGFKDEKNELGGGTLHYMNESSAFWLLYTLIGTRVNGTFKEYYGRPDPVPQGGEEPPKESLCVTSGAMHDVALLECCLAYHEHELWCCLNKLGFQMATIFYGAFMRLFATFMPTATVFRFWDILFSQSSHPKAEPSGRAYLIDLAFGTLRAKKTDIMQCESALEVRQLILGVFGAMFDTTTVVDIALVAHKFLWEGNTFSVGKIGHLWTQRDEQFRQANITLQEQNDILRVITHERPLGRIPQTKYESPPNAKGVTTKELLKDVLPVMQQSFETLRPRTQGSGRYWAMHRPMPLVAKALTENSVEKAWTQMSNAIRGAPLTPIPCMVGPPEGTEKDKKAYPGLEPLDISGADMTTVLQKDIPAWAHVGQVIWKTFTNRRDLYTTFRPQDALPIETDAEGKPKDPKQGIMEWLFADPKKLEALRQQQANHGIEERVSLNELFISLICCSKGTLGDKASALFNIYSYVEPMPTPPFHIQPLARVAKSIAKTNDGSSEHMGKNLTPPDPESIKQNALHLQVFSNYPQKNTLVGEVFVPTLGPFVGFNPNEAECQSYNIWGVQASNATRVQQTNNMNHQTNAPVGVTGDKVVVGDMEMALTWTPKSIKQPEEGQLCIRLRSIRFFKMYVSEYFKMNPRVTVHTYKKGKDQKIPRWDPRGLIGNDLHHSYLTTSGAFGGNIDFEPTMKEGITGHGDHFRHWFRHGADMGFNPDTEEWVWNEIWGKQFSVETFSIDKEFMALSQRKNVMDIHGVRHIVTGILNRSMLNVTNRQALLIADALFNRQGAVPAILEAVISQGDNPAPENEKPESNWNLKKLKDKWIKDKAKGPVDVTNAIVIEHERQCQRFGFMNLFHESFMKDWQLKNQKVLNLKDMNILDPFAGSRKTLWIRYVRSGDGERCTQGILLDKEGNILSPPHGPVPEIKLDLQECWPQTKVTKEEFISCMLNSPLLGESLRRIGATDHALQPKKSIPLDVTIMDPHQEETDQAFMDAVNVGQTVLLEVWDADVASKDFLGEAWLPPLSSLTSVAKDYVLPLKAADMSDESENGSSRESKNKSLSAEQKITGELYVRLAWKYPAYEMQGEGVTASDGDNKGGESTFDRAQIQEKLNTGRLSMQILRAHHLRRADAAKGRDCDPQVTAWVRNDTLGQWRKKPLARTGVVRNERNPKWQGEFKDSPFDIMTGSYESRFPPKAEGWFEEMKMAMKGPRARRHLREDREMNAIKRFGSGGLKVKFFDVGEGAQGGQNQDGGDNHRVEVFLGDTIREFKLKLTQACGKEAEFWVTKGRPELEQRFRDVAIHFKHLVMVFVPSPKVQRLYAQKLHEGQEYKHAYNLAIQDPSSWQPLDPTRTFGQYPQFGFGRKQPQLLRIVESSESYKLLNLRYKEFEREQSKKNYQDTNDESRCYGYAKYWHTLDIGPTVDKPSNDGKPSNTLQVRTRDYEWRPAFIYKAPAAAGVDPSQMKYKVEWVFKPFKASGASPREPKSGTDERNLQEMPKQDVLLAPRCPLVDAYVHPEHVELLEQAKTFRQIGKSDWEIEVMLNKSLDDKWSSAEHKSDDTRPPRITVDMIRNYLQRRDAADASKTGGGAPATGASAKTVGSAPAKNATNNAPSNKKPTGSNKI